jgi:hypothetical protein
MFAFGFVEDLVDQIEILSLEVHSEFTVQCTVQCVPDVLHSFCLVLLVVDDVGVGAAGVTPAQREGLLIR